MSLSHTVYRFAAALFVALLVATQAQAQIQTAEPHKESSPRAAESPKETPPSAHAPAEVTALKQQVERLQTIVDRQQRALEEMDKRLKRFEESATAATVVSSASPAKAAPRAALLPPALLQPATSATSAAPAIAASAEAMTAAPAAADNAGSAAQNPNLLPAGNSANPDAGKATAPVAGWANFRPFIQTADGIYTMMFTAIGQFDFRGYPSGNAPPNGFLVRRMRTGFDGRLARYFDYRINIDLIDTRNMVRDAFLSVHRIEELQVRIGQFKAPFSQEEINPFFGQEFIERSMVNNLAPSRSPGVMAFGIINGGEFEYYVGAFNGKGLQAPNNTDAPEGAVRLRFAPWRNQKNALLKGLAFGGAAIYGRHENGLSVSGFTESRSFTFYTPDVINGSSLRVGSEFTWQIGNAMLRAEYNQTNQARDGLGEAGTNLPGVVGKGYLAQFSYLFGGAKFENGTVAPRHDLFTGEAGRQGFGAWELKARYAKLHLANGTPKSNDVETIYFGANWYLNRFVRHQFDFGIERFNDPLRSPNAARRPGDRNFFVVQTRMQFTF